VVSGEVGVGKTTVLRACLDGLDPRKAKIIYLFTPQLTTAELYATILDEFDVTLPPTTNAGEILRMLQRTLLAVHESGMEVILAVDEAQNMPEATLESLRILSNLETHKSKLLQIILVGQPELEALLARHSLRQLAQRVAVRARIKQLTFRESLRYIQHRTRSAGRVVGRPLFTVPALCYVALLARGIPRSINICCDNSLINGYGHSARRITLGIVRESCRSMKFPRAFRRIAAFAGAAVVLVGVFFASQAILRYFVVADAASNMSGLSAMRGHDAGDKAAAESAPSQEPATPPASDVPSQGEAAAAKAATETPAPAPPVDSGSADSSAPPAAATAASPDTSSPRPDPQPTPGAPAGTASPASAAPPQSLQPGSEPAPSAPLPWVAPGEQGKTSYSAPSSGKPKRAQKWLVHEGDTVYKACRATYGSCDEDTLRAVFAFNPQIRPDARIHEGEVILMPRHLVRSN
jgi:general secretion pathway protein A